MNIIIDETAMNKFSLIIGILGIIIGYVLYLKGQKLRIPYWDIRTNNLINNFTSKISKLDIKFMDKDINNLSVSKIVFWNGGREVIDIEDISKLNNLCIKPTKEGVMILDCKVISRNSEASQFEVDYDEEKNEVIMKFDYLNYRWGAVIEIIHTGVESKDLEIDGSIKGVQSIKKKKISEVPNNGLVSIFYTKKMSISIKRFIYTIYSIAFAILVFVVFREFIGLALVVLSFPFIGLLLTWKNVAPKDLEHFLREL
ncbi:hypothetical protein SAMN05660297_03419 [Natronincola peptidivorans]|uniref:Uncharacterized protein n=1 Tax=Natronincola peptidivorans TaxID=426128 RepID=A0A1I0GY14_9FIRM|nr:hypothetical protein [Natronincola peptidivorans]SET76136.1 hypothetical protein SAMN05660297_03419 [Natronincola peptidivorans]